MDRVFSDLQRLSVEAHNHAMNKWFKEVIKSMEAVVVERNEKFILDSTFLVDLSRLIPEVVRAGLDTSWIAQVLVKSKKPILKALKMKDPEEEKIVEKL